jgi:hypothetical protein
MLCDPKTGGAAVCATTLSSTTTISAVCNPFKTGYSGCKYTTSNCSSGRCLTAGTDKHGFVAGMMEFRDFTEGLVEGVGHGAWGLVKLGWDLPKAITTIGIQAVKATPRITVKFWTAARHPEQTMNDLGALIQKYCQVDTSTHINDIHACIIDQGQQLVNFAKQGINSTLTKCFSSANKLGQCAGDAAFQIGLMFTGVGEVEGAQEIRVSLMTNELEAEEVEASQAMLESLKCPGLRRRTTTAPTCLSSTNTVYLSPEILTAGNELLAAPRSAAFGSIGNVQIPENPLGEGMFGWAFATRTTKGSEIVVKVPKYNPGAKALASHRLKLGHIGGVDEVGALKKMGLFVDQTTLADGRQIIAMKRVKGIIMKDFVESVGVEKVSWSKLDSAAKKALNKMHSNGVLHNDINEGNLMVQKSTILGITTYKVEPIDFGYATVRTGNFVTKGDYQALAISLFRLKNKVKTSNTM